jgi:fructosamine-3-kinase
MDSITSEVVYHVLQQLSLNLNTSVTLSGFRLTGGGCISHASLLETSAGNFFLKWNQSAPSDFFIREAESLRELKKAAPSSLVVPKVILSAGKGILPGFILLEYLHGTFKGNIDEILGRGVAELHRATTGSFGFYHNNYCGLTLQDNIWNTDWRHFFSNQRIGTLVRQLVTKGYYSPGDAAVFDRLCARIDEILPQTKEPSLIHGDLWAGNFMDTAQGPALIDPASYYADREMEFGIMTLFGGFHDRFWKAYHESNPLPPGWKERNKIYQLYHILNHFLLFGGGYGRQALDIARYYTK